MTDNKIYITFNGLLVPMNLFTEKQLNAVLKTMTVKEKQVRRNVSSYYSPVIRKAYKGIVKNGIKYLLFPRYFLNKLKDLLKNIDIVVADTNIAVVADTNIAVAADTNIAVAATDVNKFIPNKELYPYQLAAVNHIYEKSNNQYGILYLQMDTGLGKSRVGCAFIVKIMESAATAATTATASTAAKKGLIIVPTKAIAEQWVCEFAEMYPNLNVRIYKNELTKPVTAKPTKKKAAKLEIVYDVDILVVNTFREKNISFIKDYIVMVLDEAHEYHSECNLKALWLSQTKYVLGLSATPLERPDGLDRYITLHLGDVVYPKDIPNFDITGVNFKGNVKIIEYEGCDPYCDSVLTPSGTLSSIMTINNILNDPYRLALTVNEIVRLNNVHLTPDGVSHGLVRDDLPYPKKHGVFVFVETRDFLIKLRDALLNHMDNDNLLIPQLGDDITEDAAAEDAKIEDNNDEDNNGEDNTTDEATPISVLRGGITKQTFNDAKDAKAHIVLTTYGYSRRGISLPDMTALVLVSPRRNGSRQIIGRILRRNSDELIVRQIVDIVDVHTVLKSQSNDRIRIYKEKFGKENVKKISINWEDITIPTI